MCHIGVLKCALTRNMMSEDVVFNADETHFVFDMGNGRTLDHMGDRNEKYSDIFSGKSGIYMMVMLPGAKPACIQPLVMVFQNPTSYYLIMGVPDNIVEVRYQKQPKGLIYRMVFLKWLIECRTMDKLIQKKSGDVIYAQLRWVKSF